MNFTNAKKKMRDEIIPQIEIIELTAGNHETRQEDFAHVAVRDTLIEYRVGLKIAERLATLNTGNALRRLKAAVKEFNAIRSK